MRSSRIVVASGLALLGCGSDAATDWSPDGGGSALEAGADGAAKADGASPSQDGSPIDAGPKGDSAPKGDAAPRGSDGGSSPNDASPPPPPPGCQASCTGKTCGDDGCNGTCGGCPPSQLCGTTGTCVSPTGATTIVVDASSQRTVISPAIYGVAVNSDDSMSIASLNRWGGDSTGSYNWKNDLFNTGTDWNCANYQGFFTPPSPDPGLSNSADQFVHFNISKKADSLMTIPITGWLANELTTSTPDSACAGSTFNSGCCAQIGTSESVLVDKGSTNLDPSYMSDWVSHLVSTFGSAQNGGVRYYQLDNEPDNWQGLRKDIYPSLYPPGSFCESYYSTISQVGASINQDFLNRTMAYSAAVKSADPTATVLFLSMESPLDLISLNNVECGNSGSSYTAKSSLTAAVLALGAAHEASTHQRVLDCVDLHYPVGSSLGSTSDLWDPSSSSPFPQLEGWINSTYPGTGICVSEYNWSNDGTDGSSPDPTTATMEADLLGMFGRLGVRLGAYWTTLVYKSTHLPAYNGMAMYRDYDGKGGRFGSYSIGAASSNSGVNAYAAADSPTAPTTLWVMLVNVSGKAQNNLSIGIQSFTPGASAQVYRMAGGAAPAASAAATISGGTISGVSLAAGEVALFVVSQ
jgi:hypothetical protein